MARSESTSLCALSHWYQSFSDKHKQIIDSAMNTPYVSIQSVPGSRKTDMICMIGLKIFLEKGKSVVFITQTSSVAQEIKDRCENILKEKIKRVNRSNHYIYDYGKASLAISNMDAFIHHQLTKAYPTKIYTSNFNEKVADLLEGLKSGHVTNIYLKNNSVCNNILIDEVQDLDSDKTNILLGYFKLGCRGVFVGDLLQSIFNRFEEGDHPFLKLRKHLSVEHETLDTCYRCPKGHLDFVNEMLKSAFLEYNLPPYKSFNNNITDKPLLFMHPSPRTNAKCAIIAKQVLQMIKVLMKNKIVKDNLGEIVIICKDTNDNGIFEYLTEQLTTYYKKIGFDKAKRNKSYVKHFKTKQDDGHITIDWDGWVHASKMLSIHGDKGKGHNVVFVLDFSNKKIPHEGNLCSFKEIIDRSLANVAFTRSKQVLIVGMASPSKYISEMQSKITDLSYNTWDDEKLPTYPELYKQLVFACKKTYDVKPKFNFVHREIPLLHPYNAQFSVTKISEEIEHIREIYSGNLEMTCKQFGCQAKLNTSALDDGDESYLGLMAELIVLKTISVKHSARHIVECLKFMDNVHYTLDDYLLNLSWDASLNSKLGDFEEWKSTMNNVLNTFVDSERVRSSLKSLDEVQSLETTKVPLAIIPKWYNNESVKNGISKFIDIKCPPRCLSCLEYWNLALLLHEVSPSIYGRSLRKPATKFLLNKLDTNLDDVHANVEAYVDMYQALEVCHLRIQMPQSITVTEKDPYLLESYGFNKEIDADIFDKGYMSGIVGRSDIYNQLKSCVVDIKLSKSQDLLQKWWVQSLLYTCIHPGIQKAFFFPKSLEVVNVLQGTLFTCRIDHVTFDDRVSIVKNVLERKNVAPEQIENVGKHLMRRWRG